MYGTPKERVCLYQTPSDPSDVERTRESSLDESEGQDRAEEDVVGRLRRLKGEGERTVAVVGPLISDEDLNRKHARLSGDGGGSVEQGDGADLPAAGRDLDLRTAHADEDVLTLLRDDGRLVRT